MQDVCACIHKGEYIYAFMSVHVHVFVKKEFLEIYKSDMVATLSRFSGCDIKRTK
jgi:hypothetical protein